jgi:PAS domain S-box-containing protein
VAEAVARAVERAPGLRADELPELLGNLAEAPNFSAGAAMLLEQLADAAGAARGLLLILDRNARQLSVEQRHGLPHGAGERLAVALDDGGHPLVVSARGLEAVWTVDGSFRLPNLPFERWFALPLPQPQFRGAPALRETAAWSFEPRYAGCEIVRSGSAQQRRRFGRAPFGVVVIEGHPEAATIDSLITASLLAGPILARIHAVDDLRHSAQQLDEQHGLLSAIINALPDPIVITDALNNVVVQNRRAEMLLASTDNDSEGRRRAVEINNLLFSSFLSKAVISGGVARSTARELNLVDPDEGADLLFEVLAQPLPETVAREGAFVSVLRDVTDLKRASIELERQYQRARLTEQDATRERDRLNLILSNVGDPILVTDHQSKIILMNPQAEQLFELPDAIADRRHAQRVRGNDTKFTTIISDFAVSPATYRRERITLEQPITGEELPVEVVAGKVLNERGEPLAIVSVLHDLTKQVENERLNVELQTLNFELEDRIRLATADLEEQNLRLQWQSNELEKAYRLKSEFLANMSHELRTPINALIGYTSLMLDRIYGELTKRQEEGLTRIQVASNHLLALINDILDLAKIEAGKMPVHLEPMPLRQIITEVAAQMEPQIRKKQLEFRIDVDADMPVMFSDRTKVKQIVLNLLSNAAKFTHHGEVAIIARPRGNRVQILVRDTGIGIRPEHKEIIFEEFRQVDQSRTREYGGTGLGLSITRKLVALLGGEIHVESDYGRGSTFVVTLPVRSEVMTLEEHISRATGAERASS